MSTHLASYLGAFEKLRVVVVGDSILDRYVSGETTKLCREAPVPIVSVRETKECPGGAANVALNLKELGAAVHLISAVGDDDWGEHLETLLTARGVTSNLTKIRGCKTICKTRYLSDGQMLARFDEGSLSLTAKEEEELAKAIPEALDGADIVICSEYGYGLFSPPVVSTLAAARKETLLVVDSRGRHEIFRSLNPDLIKPNYEEFRYLLSVPDDPSLPRWERVHSLSEELFEKTGARIAAVTLDRDGAIILQPGSPPVRTASTPVHNSKATGAGDTYIAAFSLALASGAGVRGAAEIAASSAIVVLRKEGTATCSAGELESELLKLTKVVTDLSHLEEYIRRYRSEGRRVVFTNGCFDILHPGSLECLHRARELGDVLVVGVNTDESVRRVKGPNRPLNRLSDRIKILNALSCIEHIVPFADETACDLIRAIRPDYFVKGGNRTIQQLPEAPLVEELGGEVVILPLLEEGTTSALIEKIRMTEVAPPLLASESSPPVVEL